MKTGDNAVGTGRFDYGVECGGQLTGELMSAIEHIVHVKSGLATESESEVCRSDI
jgi:hypothetical protein